MKDITKVQTESEIFEVSSLAREIWVEHYTPITGIEQVEYMLDKYLSVSAISSQIDQGYEFYTINYEGRISGFLSIVPDLGDESLFLSKIYTHKSVRGKGFGKKMLEFTEKKCREKGCNTLWLTVNKNNSNTIAWYEKMGFRNVESIVTDIGNGFVMDDYKMEKAIGIRD